MHRMASYGCMAPPRPGARMVIALLAVTVAVRSARRSFAFARSVNSVDSLVRFSAYFSWLPSLVRSFPCSSPPPSHRRPALGTSSSHNRFRFALLLIDQPQSTRFRLRHISLSFFQQPSRQVWSLRDPAPNLCLCAFVIHTHSVRPSVNSRSSVNSSSSSRVSYATLLMSIPSSEPSIRSATPLSVTMALIRLAGVTSKLGLYTPPPSKSRSGVTWTTACACASDPCSRPRTKHASNGGRCSMGILPNP